MITRKAALDLGPVKRWKDDDGIYHAENDWLALTWAATDDPNLIGKLGFHGPNEICVEYISRETAEKLERRWGLTYDEGYDKGYDDGYAEGHANGYAEGSADEREHYHDD